MTEPFLEYLTVFRARLGAVNIVLGLTTLSHIPEETLLRKIRQILEAKVSLNLADRKNDFVFTYLKDKSLVHDNQGASGRYEGLALIKQGDDWRATDRRGKNLDNLPVFQTDLWMADPQIRSTIGVPTPDNAKEIVDLAFQLRLLSRGKVTWTSAGHLVQRLRSYHRGEDSADYCENPFLLGIDAVALFRQVIEFDGFLIRELLRVLLANTLRSDSDLVSRDGVAGEFARVVSNAVDALRGHFPVTSIYRAKQFKRQMEETAKKRPGQSRGPGVLEHRVSPRLEWLVDFGYLSKEGLSKNGFAYRVEAAARSLLDDLDKFIGKSHWAESVAISQWRSNPIWHDIRSNVNFGDRTGVFLKGYELLQRPVGPSPLNDVVFVSALLSASASDYSEVETEIISFAQRTDGVTLSGGRLHRSPQNIYISDKVLGN